jgi:PAS domain S-box-containing protein
MSNPSKIDVQDSADTLRRRLSELEAVSAFHEETGRVLGPSPSAGALQEMLDLVRGRFGLRSVAYLRHDEGTKELVPEGMSPTTVPKGSRRRNDEGPSGRALKGGVAIREESQDRISSLSIPVRNGNRALGVLELTDVAAGRFTEGLQAAVESAAGKLALFLETRAGTDTRREDSYKTIVENAAYPIMTLDATGNFTWANRATHSLLGYGRGELDGLNVTQVIRKGHVRTMFTAIKECAEGLEVRAQRIDVITRRGEERTARCRATPCASTARTSASS